MKFGLVQVLTVRHSKFHPEQFTVTSPPSVLRYSNLFQNATATNEGKWADFAYFASKIGSNRNVI